jgi:hypothetical protein
MPTSGKPPPRRRAPKVKRPSEVRPDVVRLQTTVENFCAWIESLPEREMRAREWGPREVLAHLVYWHEWYLAQSEAILAGRTFPLPSGRFRDLNAAAAAKYRNVLPSTLTRRFRATNRRLSRLAMEHNPDKIVFRIKADSKPWKLADLIPAAEAHVRNHLYALKKASNG